MRWCLFVIDAEGQSLGKHLLGGYGFKRDLPELSKGDEVQ